MTEVVFSKLAPPRMAKDLLERPRLMDLLSGLENRKATLLLAPAGYGKTSATLQAVEHEGLKFVWYQLDNYDNDPALFIQCLTTGIQRQFPGFGGQVLQFMEQGKTKTRLRLSVASIVNGLICHVGCPLVLVMDDFHVITNPLVLRFMQELLERLPGHIHMMIASRTMPPLSLARLKIANEILIIGPDELRFTTDEIRSLLAQKSASYQAQTEMATLLNQELNGWPALVKLTVGAGFPLSKAGDHSEIFDYLAAEVLERLPGDVQEFLLKTSILEVITAEESDSLLQRHDSAQMLSRLERENLFLTRLAGAKHSYRHHQLVREFLLERLGPRRPSLQRAAGMMAWERSDLTAAVEYFAAAGGAAAELTSVMKEAGRQAFRQGRWQTVQRWLANLTPAQIAADPWLSLFMARVETYKGRMEEAVGWVEPVTAIFAARGDLTGLAESRLLRARILRYKGFYQQSLELLEEAYPYLHLEQGGVRFDLPIEKSLCLVMTGRFREAETLLKSILEEAVRGDDRNTIAYLYEGLGHTYYLQGDYDKALQMYNKRLEIAPERELPYYYTQDYIAAIYQEWGELDQAYAYIQRSMAFKEKMGLTDTLPSAYYQLADIYLNRGEFKNAEKYFRRAIDLIQKTSEERFYLTLNQAYLARCLSEQGKLADAQAMVEEALQEAKSTSGLALAICQELGAPVYWAYGKKEEARALLAQAIVTLEEMGFPRPLGHAYAAAALFHAAAGEQAKASEYARKTLELSARKNYCQSFLVAFDIFKPILQYSLTQGIEVIFTQKVLARLGKRALPLLDGLAHHPDARVRLRIVTPLGEIGNQQAIHLLETLAGDRDESVGRLAGEALERIKISLSADSGRESTILTLGTLGPLLVMQKGEVVPVSWRTAKARDLLAFLAHQAGPVTQDVILEELWPEHTPDKAKGLFHTNLYYLRQVFRQIGLPGLIAYQNNSYELGAGVSTDARLFMGSIALGFHGELEPEKICELLERTVELYRGDYLAELDYPWLLPLRENLKNLYSEARLWLARYYIENQHFHLALGHLRILIGMNPLNEEPYRLLMKTQAGLGNTVAVRKEYRALQSLLDRELSLPPAKETRELYKKLMTQDNGRIAAAHTS